MLSVKPYVAKFTAARGIHGANKGSAPESRHKIGKIPESWWADGHLSNVSAWMHERTGKPTQKPVSLYYRLVLASTNEGDLVIDPFCGCATTLIAAENAGRQWIGMDINPTTEELVIKQLDKLSEGTEDFLAQESQIPQETAETDGQQTFQKEDGRTQTNSDCSAAQRQAQLSPHLRDLRP